MIYFEGIPFLDQEGVDNYIKKREELKHNGINYDLNNRWETGVPHHKKSLQIMKRISDLDMYFQGDYFCWKYGGDGDNGESLMYLLDLYFEEEDLKKKEKENGN